MRRHGPYIAWSATFHRDDGLEVGERAAWLYLCMCGESRLLRSDGWLTERQVAGLGVTGWRQRMPPLLASGLVESARGEGPTRYWIPAYLKWNKSEQAYRDDAERGRHYACLRWHDQPCERESCAGLQPKSVDG